MKAAVILLSDPKATTEEATGRAFNALSAVYDFKQQGDEVKLLFQGAGTRWAGTLAKKDHPFHDLYVAVKDKVQGVSCGCAQAFGATDDALAEGLNEVKENLVPGTTGLPSLRNMIAEGFTILVF